MKRSIKDRRGTIKTLADGNGWQVKDARETIVEVAQPLRNEALTLTGDNLKANLHLCVRFMRRMGESFGKSPVSEQVAVVRQQLGNRFNGSALNGIVALYRIGIRSTEELEAIVTDTAHIVEVTRRAVNLVPARQIIGQMKQADVLDLDAMREGFAAVLGFLNDVQSETHAQQFAFRWVLAHTGYAVKFVTEEMLKDALGYFDAYLIKADAAKRDGVAIPAFNLDEFAAIFKATKTATSSAGDILTDEKVA